MLLSGNKFFGGVYSINNLPLVIPTTKINYIINLDPSYQPGSHWVSVYIDSNRRAIYFDSFGRPPPPEILSFMQRSVSFYQISKSKYQGDDSSACGYYCLLFVLMSNKKSFFKLMKSCNHSRNEYLIYKKLLSLLK